MPLCLYHHIAHPGLRILFFSILLLISLTTSAQIPRSQHVVLVIEENHTFSEVQSYMPWLVSQGNANGYASNYFAENGGSLKDYLWLASGSCHNASACTLPAGTNDFGCTGNACTSPITDDNIFHELNIHGIDWRVYAQSYAAAGGTVTTPDGANGTSYYRRHNGATWYDEILSNRAADGTYPKIVDFSQFATDLANNALPPFVIIVPDGAHDAHDCGSGAAACLGDADNFLEHQSGTNAEQVLFPGRRRWNTASHLRRMWGWSQYLHAGQRLHCHYRAQGNSSYGLRRVLPA